jgi:hypothetical protein
VYSQARPDIRDVARHVLRIGEEVDSALVTGLPEIVDRIAEIDVCGKGRRRYFSFATKYCSWHKPESYPIYDSRVDRCLRRLKGEPLLSEFFNSREDRWRYSEFRRLITAFRELCGLTSFSFKDIDKFLYKYGREGAPVAAARSFFSGVPGVCECIVCR